MSQLNDSFNGAKETQQVQDQAPLVVETRPMAKGLPQNIHVKL